MALNDADRAWLEGRFSSIAGGVDGLKTDFYNLEIKVEKHLSAPCRGIKDHEEKSLAHNPVKFWSLLSSIVAVISGVIMFLYNHLKNGGGK